MTLKQRLLLIRRSIWGRKLEWAKMTTVLFIATIVILITNAIVFSFYNYADKYVLNTPDFRTILIHGNENNREFLENSIREIASNNSHILNVEEETWGTSVEVAHPEQFVPNDYDMSNDAFGKIFLEDDGYIDKRYLVDGEWIDPSDSNVGVIAKQFSFTFQSEELLSSNLTYLDGADFIGKELTSHYYSYKEEGDHLVKDLEFEYKFKVIGTFDNVAAGTLSCTTIIPYDDLKTTFDTLEQHSDEIGTIGVSYRAVIDNEHNVPDILKEIQNAYQNHYISASVRSTPGMLFNIVYMIKIVGRALSALLYLMSFFMMFLMIHKTIKKRTNEIGVYKAIGYSNYNITLNILLEVIVLGVLVYLFALGLTLLILGGLNLLIAIKTSIIINKIRFYLNGTTVFYSLLFCLLVPIISSLRGLSFSMKLEPRESITKVCE